MHPPSYYSSLAHSNSSGYHGASNSTRSQFISTFASSPAYNQSSSAYVTRTHLPYVSQSMLVAHCITGAGSSTRPYGQQSAVPSFAYSSPSSSLSSNSTSSSSPSSSISSSSLYSTYRPLSTKSRQSKNPYLNSSAATTTTSALSPTTRSHSSYPSSYSFNATYRSPATSSLSSSSANYLSPYSSSSHSTTTSSSSSAASYRPSYRSPNRPTALSSYYNPIRLRERPLLTQISRQINLNKETTNNADRAATIKERELEKSDSSRVAKDRDRDKDKSVGVQRKEDDETWSSDVARNISRNKYLIKFKEFDKRASISPIPPPSAEENIENIENNNLITTRVPDLKEINRLNLIDSFDIQTAVGGESLLGKDSTIKSSTTSDLIKPIKEKKLKVKTKESSTNKEQSNKDIVKNNKMRIPIRSNKLPEVGPLLAKAPVDLVVARVSQKSSDLSNNNSNKSLLKSDEKTKSLVNKSLVNENEKIIINSAVDNKKSLPEIETKINCDKSVVLKSKQQTDIVMGKENKIIITSGSGNGTNEAAKESNKLKLVKEKKNVAVKLLVKDNNNNKEVRKINNNNNNDLSSVSNLKANDSDKKLAVVVDNKLLKPVAATPAAVVVGVEKSKPEVAKIEKVLDNQKRAQKLEIVEAVLKVSPSEPAVVMKRENKMDTGTDKSTTTNISKPKVKKLIKTGSKTKLTPSLDENSPAPKPKRKVLVRKQSGELKKASKENVVEVDKKELITSNDDNNNSNKSSDKSVSLATPAPISTRMVTETKENKRIRFREYNLEDFNFLSVLGHGGWGFVILAELKEHDACFAVKCIKKITIVEDDDFDSIMIERKVLTLGNIHPFICKLFCTFETDGYLFFAMEYCAGGDLMFHVQREGKFTESRCRFYAAEIICAIRFLHNRHIIYSFPTLIRDLKLDNILLDLKGHIRLVDFGMCQCRTYREEMLPSNFCGTPEYISPEIIKGVPYNHSVDWWSFGVLLYEMAVGKMPFRGNDENELLWNVCYEQIHYPMFLTRELTNLLQLLLEREPTKRMGMSTCKSGDIYDQAWFRGVDWASFEEMRVPPPFIPEVTSKRDVQNFDADFTESAPVLSPVDESTLKKIDQSQFEKFPYTNPNISMFESA